MIGIGLGLTFGKKTQFNPASLFATGAYGFWYDPAILPTLSQDSAGTTPVTAIGQPTGRVRDRGANVANALQSTAGFRPLYARAPAGGLRNVAHGAAAVSDPSYWNASTSNNGITATLVGSGIDVDGLPYADYDVAGTASANSNVTPYIVSNSRRPGTIGDTYTTSCLSQILINTLMPSGAGVRADAIGETAPSTYVEAGVSAVSQSATEVLLTATRTISSGSTNQVRTGITFFTFVGQTVDYRVRIKALQFEVGAARTAFQSNLSRADITETGKASRYALLFDQVDDAMEATLAAGTYTVAYGDDAGVTVLTGLPLSGAYTLPAPARAYGYIGVNSNLTVAETEKVTNWLDGRRP